MAGRHRKSCCRCRRVQLVFVMLQVCLVAIECAETVAQLIREM